MGEKKEVDVLKFLHCADISEQRHSTQSLEQTRVCSSSRQ